MGRVLEPIRLFLVDILIVVGGLFGLGLAVERGDLILGIMSVGMILAVGRGIYRERELSQPEGTA